MDKKEKVYAWRPIDNLFGKFFVRAVSFDLDGFRIELVKYDDVTRGLLVDFGGAVRSYKVTDDLLSMHHLQGPVIPHEDFTSSEDLSLWSFFTVINSDYLRWASYQSDGVSDSLGLVHYAIWTEDWIVDVLSWCKPEVTWIEIKEQ